MRKGFPEHRLVYVSQWIGQHGVVFCFYIGLHAIGHARGFSCGILVNADHDIYSPVLDFFRTICICVFSAQHQSGAIFSIRCLANQLYVHVGHQSAEQGLGCGCRVSGGDAVYPFQPDIGVFRAHMQVDGIVIIFGHKGSFQADAFLPVDFGQYVIDNQDPIFSREEDWSHFNEELEKGEVVFQAESVEELERSKDFEALTNITTVGLAPRAITEKAGTLMCDSVYNVKSGEFVPVAHGLLMVGMKTPKSLGVRVLAGVLTWVSLVAIIWALVLFVRIIVAINRSDIFNWLNVRRLRRLGLLLIIDFGCTCLSAYLTLCSLRQVFGLEHYELELPDTVSSTTLMLGLVTLIVAEVFAIGLKMKEEQDLTI